MCLGLLNSQLGEERKGIREKGRWPHSNTCCPLGHTCLQETVKGWRNTPSHKATFKYLLSPPLYTGFTHDLREIKLLALRYHLEPQFQGKRESQRVRLKRAKTAPGKITSIPCFSKIHFMLLHFYEGPMLVPVFDDLKKKIWRQFLVSFKKPKL